MNTPLPFVLLVSALAALQPATATAEQVRFRFAPADACGNMTPQDPTALWENSSPGSDCGHNPIRALFGPIKW